MRLFLTCLFIAAAQAMLAQPLSQLMVRKGVKVKKRLFEGNRILIKDREGFEYSGIIYQFTDDSIFLSTSAVSVNNISQITLPRKPRRQATPLVRNLVYTTLGVGLTASLISLADQGAFTPTLASVAGLSYSSIALEQFSRISVKKRKYRIGKKYQLRIWYLPPVYTPG
jgi:hypothetical protein